jgi:hypothetical protein
MTLPCNQCQAPVEVLEGAPTEHGVLCQQCTQRTIAEQAAHSRQLAMAARWGIICPVLYRDTDMSKLPCPDRTERAMRWHPNGSGRGLNLFGFPATGKTRTLFLILQRAHFAGVTIKVYTSGEFERDLERRSFKRAPLVTHLCSVDLLAFDDFDKLNLTREMEKVFFAIVDRRMADAKPVLLTHNSTAPELEYRFRFGEPLVRRIRDFCESVHFPKL